MQVRQRQNDAGKKKDWIKGTILVIAWFLTISLIKDLWQIKKGFIRVEESKQRLGEVERKNQELKDKLGLVMTEEYKEKVIREQLNMQKTGEVVAVLPQKTDETSLKEESGEENKEETNWKKWWSLLK